MPERIERALLWLLGATYAIVGAWAAFAPRSFYDDFPGGGRHWVSADGPYNEHLVRDVGELNLALALVAVVAAVRLGPTLVRLVAGASLIYGAPHLVYHLRHLDVYATGDQVANVASLGLGVVVPVFLLAISARPISRTVQVQAGVVSNP